ncbi:MAG: hypothetical protein ACPG14_03155 [Flavobacteriaceae bacterium]
MYRKYSVFIFFGLMLNTTTLATQEVKMAPKEFIFSWQKANGDKYDIPVTNNLKVEIAQKRVNRALMQILLKSVLKSRDFESFNPLYFTLRPDTQDQVAEFEFSLLGGEGESQEYTYYFRFDVYGNVFNQLDNY